MYPKLLKILAFFLFVVLIFPTGNSFAFKSLTRDQLVYDAIEFCPAELKAYLLDNLATVSSGMHFKERHRHGSYLIDPYDTELVYHHLIKDLKEGKYNEFNTAHAFGVIACFLAETISPDNYRTPSHLIPNDVSYDGYQEVGDVKSNISGLIENYRIPYRRRMQKKITDQLYKVAVNEIVDYWVSAWEASGYQTGRFADTGKKINHRIVVLKSKGAEG
ncbi:MAG: hypothetical protein KAR15_19790 [Desulfobacterales bacterium]|nr:hypothetical protein [Desulfobacterales bacterium]